MILVTGSSGFVGRSLMRLFEATDYPVKRYMGRMNDPLALRAELLDVDTVVHLAGSEARGRVRLLHHVDIEGTERLIEESKRMGARRLIFASRLGADPHSAFPLLQAKGEVERLLRRSGLAYTILRTATLHGRDDRFLTTIARLATWSWPFVWLPGGGHVAMQPLWVEDFAHCLLQTVGRPDLANKTIELAGEELFRYRDIVQIVLETAGLRRLPLRPPLLIVRPTATLAFGWQRRPAVSRFFLDRFSAPDVASIDSVQRHFGFSAGHLRQHIAHLRRY